MPTPIHEHTHEHRAEVGELQLEGWMAPASCTVCRGPLIHYVVFDALFCPECNAWTAILCQDPGCTYCRVRPERPRAA
jgi:hypothetical protein